jgi:small subunit ribosomal protein S20
LPNIKSAIKRVNVAKAKTLRNVTKRSALKTSIKKCKVAIGSGTGARDALNDTISLLDKAASKKLIHRNTAARRKSKLARAYNKSLEA